MVRGMGVTFKNLVLPSRQFAVQYPNRKISLFELAKENDTDVVSFAINNPVQAIKALAGFVEVPVRLPQHSRFRGEEFTWYEQRCTGCASCAKFCPLGIIKIVTDTSGKYEQDGGKYDIEVFDIDIGRCMFCGLCVQACPYDALHMGSGFEEGKYSREELVINKQKLVDSEKHPSNWFRPQLETKTHNPFESDAVEWKNVGRHEQPSMEDLEDRWADR